jgi:FMN phosphatase YigB (HAD superfamily)
MIKLICCDCNGVLEHINHDYSKSGIYVDNSEIIGKINNFIFGTKYLLNSWMTGEITYKELNRLLSYKFNVNENYLDDLLVQNMNDFIWNWDLINLFQKYRNQNIKVLMTTNNNDIFTLVAVPKNDFNKYFDKIYNSAEVKYLKEENNLQLFEKISFEYKINKNEILIIDDNKSIIKMANELGYKTYLYNMETSNDFEKWFEENNSVRNNGI